MIPHPFREGVTIVQFIKGGIVMSCYGFSRDNLALLLDGKIFFTSPIANDCMGSLHVGLVMDSEKIEVQLKDPMHTDNKPFNVGWAETAVIVAGGNCCDGYVIGVSKEGKITKILAVDFNIRRIVPVVYSIPNKDPKKEPFVVIGLLVSGSGCSGSGVRFIDFNRVTPTSTVIVATDEIDQVKSYKEWLYGASPLTVPDIWERIQKAGINVDKEKSLIVANSLETFR